MGKHRAVGGLGQENLSLMILPGRMTRALAGGGLG